MILSNTLKAHLGSDALPTYGTVLVLLSMATAPWKVTDLEFLIKNQHSYKKNILC